MSRPPSCSWVLTALVIAAVARAAAAQPAPARAPIEVAFVGDVMFGRYVGGRLQPIPADRPRLLDGARAVLADADLAVANLETPVIAAPPARGPRERRRFAANPDQLAVLAGAGFDALSLANNHSDDLGDDGTTATPALIAAAGMTALGAAHHGPELLAVESVAVGAWRLGFIAVTTVRNRSQRAGAPRLRFVADPELLGAVAPIVASARADHDAVIVLVHWGREHHAAPDPAQRVAARAWIDAGAAAVIGHHPHVLQPIERYRGGVIAYSLGNFLFDNLGPRARRTGILTLTFADGAPCLAARFTPLVLGSGYRPGRPGRADARAIRAAIGGDLAGCPDP
jgi:poly-gamma-glutamate capsule biosynthesis protein CapA/YwtB (metallophosphatase superfamily)